MILEEFSAWFVWVIPLIASLFVPVIAKYSEKARNYFVMAIAAVVSVLALTLVPGVWGLAQPSHYYTINWLPGVDGSSIAAGVYVDPLSVLFTCLVAFFALIIAIYSQGYMKGEEGLTRYYYLLLLFIGSMIGLVLADNMLQMFIFWEMVGLCSYALISFWYKKPESIRSGVKVFIMTRIGDIMLLAAIGILFYMFGTFSFRGIISGLEAGGFNIDLMVLVAFLVLGGAVAKSAQFPLFTWLYSAMEAPTSVSALLHAATMVKAGIYLLSRFILIFSVAPTLIAALQLSWFPTVAWIGVITAFIGATLGLMTTDIKGVLAYSTVSQIGFMMAALGTAMATTSDVFMSTGWFASLFHMVSHAFFEGLGFLLAGGIIHALGTRDMRLMGGLRKAMPISFALMFIMIITTSGLPPFAAFFSKGLIITSVTDAGSLIQTILIYLSAGITFAYCLRMFSLVFMGKPSEHIQKIHVHEAPKVMLIPAAILAVLCIAWGLAQPLVASFMDVELETTLLGAFTSLETPIFLTMLVPIFFLAYYTYYKNWNAFRKVAAGRNPITITLNHAYFLDDFYNAIAKGINGFSAALTRVENALFSRYPDEAGTKVGEAAEPGHATVLKKGPSDSFRNYVAAAVLGFVLIIVLIILTLGIGA
ncbi:MAG: NADH-quinone oxidoreductase subunit L [Candidatus Bathyarchaeota archaeon]|nr:NADH-quinone oxidoreductase subunit L [Candidatus Bathyarchaeota archaeon]